jgi:hypothetical protein
VKFILVFMAIGLLALVAVWVGPHFNEHPHPSPAWRPTRVSLAMRRWFWSSRWPQKSSPVLLKLGSAGFRFVRYYAGDPRYRAAGPPELVMRLLAPAVVVLTVALFSTGIELWLFGFRFGNQWLTWHKVVFVLWFLAMTFHVFAYLRRAPELAVADSRDRLFGAVARRSLVFASLLLGAVLVVAMLPFTSPFPPLAGGP